MQFYNGDYIIGDHMIRIHDTYTGRQIFFFSKKMADEWIDKAVYWMGEDPEMKSRFELSEIKIRLNSKLRETDKNKL